MSKGAFEKVAAGLNDAIAFAEGDSSRGKIAAAAGYRSHSLLVEQEATVFRSRHACRSGNFHRADEGFDGSRLQHRSQPLFLCAVIRHPDRYRRIALDFRNNLRERRIAENQLSLGPGRSHGFADPFLSPPSLCIHGQPSARLHCNKFRSTVASQLCH